MKRKECCCQGNMTTVLSIEIFGIVNVTIAVSTEKNCKRFTAITFFFFEWFLSFAAICV